MTVRPILLLPDPRLRLVSAPVATVDDRIRALADDMLDTMYKAPGIGLAAIQIGEPVRLVTIDVAKENEERRPFVLINPEILRSSEALSTYNEGCLSIPEYYEDVERPADVTVRYSDRDGAVIERVMSGLLATCVQHEIDHLDGVLFIDHLSRLKRDRVTKKFTKAARERARKKPEPDAA